MTTTPGCLSSGWLHLNLLEIPYGFGNWDVRIADLGLVEQLLAEYPADD